MRTFEQWHESLMKQKSLQFERELEPTSLTENELSVSEYGKVMATNMTVNYALTFEMINRATQFNQYENLLDLCSGPGLMTNALKKHFGFSTAMGVDGSERMIDIAKELNKEHSKGLEFKQANVFDLQQTLAPNTKFSHILMSNSAHHFTNMRDLAALIGSFEQFLTKNGLIVISDLCRLPTPALSDEFVSFAGSDYLESGMPAFYEDFRRSMRAALTSQEFKDLVPGKTTLYWTHLVSGVIPFFQVLIGSKSPLQPSLFLGPPKDWIKSGLIVSERAKLDWQALSPLLTQWEVSEINKKEETFLQI